MLKVTVTIIVPDTSDALDHVQEGLDRAFSRVEDFNINNSVDPFFDRETYQLSTPSGYVLGHVACIMNDTEWKECDTDEAQNVIPV